MVKVTHKIIRKANLRQSIRPKINRFNLRQIVRKPLGKHNANIPNIHKFSLCQRSTQNFSQYNIQNDNQNENSSIGEDYFNENNQEEEYKNDNNNISDNDYFDENYDDDNQENYFYQEYHQEEGLDEYEDNCNNNTDDISFVFKDQYDGLHNIPSYHGEAKPYFPNKSVMLMFIWCTKHMIGNDYNFNDANIEGLFFKYQMNF